MAEWHKDPGSNHLVSAKQAYGAMRWYLFSAMGAAFMFVWATPQDWGLAIVSAMPEASQSQQPGVKRSYTPGFQSPSFPDPEGITAIPVSFTAGSIEILCFMGDAGLFQQFNRLLPKRAFLLMLFLPGNVIMHRGTCLRAYR